MTKDLTKRPVLRRLALAIGIGALGQPMLAADLGAVDETIKLAMLEWTGAQVSSQVFGHVLEKAGYKVEYVTAGNFPQYSGLADGSLSASVEVWMNNVGEIYPTELAAGHIENVGQLKLETNEGWLYPKFMEQMCPGLPDWTALKTPECVAALATADTLPQGRFLDYPADWGSRAATIIADNSLPLIAVPAGSEGAMVAELRASLAAKTPLMMMFWGPHFALAGADVGWITMPPCVDTSNEHCITPPEVNKIVWSGFGAKWPAAYEILKSFELHAADQQVMMAQVDDKGETLDAVAAAWVAANEAVWKPWVDRAVQ